MKTSTALKLSGSVIEGDYEMPLATYEAPLWPSVNRGARVSMNSRVASNAPS